jgi:hypothetical protein
VRITKEKLQKLMAEPRITMRDWLISRHPLPSAGLPGIARSRFFPRVAIGRTGNEILAEIVSSLRRAHIQFISGGAQDKWANALHFRMADFNAVTKIIERMNGDPRVAFSYGAFNTLSAAAFCQKVTSKRASFFLVRPMEKTGYVNSESTFACSNIEFHFWTEIATYSGEQLYQSPRDNGSAYRIRESTFLNLLKAGACFDDMRSSLYETDFPIDVVYTWVDDQDEDWQREKATYAGTLTEYSAKHRSDHAERWRNRDELRYSLRSIEMFAPFVRNIYLVTNGQIPTWLDTSNSRLKVVPHADIYRHPDHLPTFNSSGIETQLHHIDGLSEHFLYFNDDFFLGDFCTPEDFFYPNGSIKFFPSDQYAFREDIDLQSEAYIIADANVIDLMHRDLGRTGSNIMMHVPYPSRKSLLDQLEDRYQAEFDTCAGQRFRSPKDVRPIAFWQYHAGFAEGIAYPSDITHRYLSLWKPTIAEQFANVYKNRAFKTFCINDVGVRQENIESSDRLVHDFLSRYFPFPSAFEKEPTSGKA